jgi:N-acetylglucosaminyldiphosphoundecaprenol N-acetyl-beta-D-mannosaminyltransferase
MFEYDDAVVRLTHPNAAAMMADVRQRMTHGEGFALATVKVEDLVEFGRDSNARRAFVAHDILVAEGRPVAWLARLAGQAIEVVPGADLILPLARLSAVSKRPVALVGGSAEALQAVADDLRTFLPKLDIRLQVATADDIDPEGPDARAALARVAEIGPCLCLVGLGAQRRERFAALGRQIAPQAGFVSLGGEGGLLAADGTSVERWKVEQAMDWMARSARSPRGLVVSCLTWAGVLSVECVAALRRRFGNKGGMASLA